MRSVVKWSLTGPSIIHSTAVQRDGSMCDFSHVGQHVCVFFSVCASYPHNDTHESVVWLEITVKKIIMFYDVTTLWLEYGYG